MPPLRALSDVELARLSDDELVARIAATKRAGQHDEARMALQVLVFGHMGSIERRARIKLPEHAVEQVVAEAFWSALRSALDGESVGEFRGWLNRIVDRRIADYYRAPRLETEPLGSATADTGEQRRRAEPAAAEETGAVDARSAVDRVLDALRPSQRQVIELYVFDDLPAREAAERVNREPAEPQERPMTENNVHKIAERFRTDLREELGGADTS